MKKIILLSYSLSIVIFSLYSLPIAPMPTIPADVGERIDALATKITRDVLVEVAYYETAGILIAGGATLLGAALVRDKLDKKALLFGVLGVLSFTSGSVMVLLRNQESD